MNAFEKISSALRSKGLKVTPQRIAVYEAILALNNHPDTDRIIAKVTKKNPTISPATVYKTLDMFVEHGIIVRIKTGSGRMRFDKILENHHHLYDDRSEKIEDYNDEELDNILIEYFKSKELKKFKVVNIKLQINGKFK